MGSEDFSFFSELLAWIGKNKVGDIASILGLMLAIGGFIVTIIKINSSKSQINFTSQAVKAVEEQIRSMNNFSDFATAISTIDEIKRLHRVGAWQILPERYSSLRKLIISLKVSSNDLTDDQRSDLQSAIGVLSDLESKVEKGIRKNELQTLNTITLNKVMSDQVDKLHEMLVDIKSKARSMTNE